MKKLKNNLVRATTAFALVVALIGCSANANAASKASKSINSTYGSITGETYGLDVKNSGKMFESRARTTKRVPKIYTDIDLKYYTTGNTIAKDNHWVTNSNTVLVTMYMNRYKNALNNNRKDGFVKTKCTAYGCAEAIISKSYTVYTSCVY